MANLKNKNGFGLIEALFGIAMAATLILTFTTLNLDTIKVSRANVRELKALLYAKELIEVGKELEQSNWTMITDSSCGGYYHPIITDDKWNLVSGEESLENNSYSRWIIIENVFRNQLSFPNKISSAGCGAGANNSTSTKKITATVVSKDSGRITTTTLEAYLYNYE